MGAQGGDPPFHPGFSSTGGHYPASSVRRVATEAAGEVVEGVVEHARPLLHVPFGGNVKLSGPTADLFQRSNNTDKA